jgi:hypothetical protein
LLLLLPYPNVQPETQLVVDVPLSLYPQKGAAPSNDPFIQVIHSFSFLLLH